MFSKVFQILASRGKILVCSPGKTKPVLSIPSLFSLLLHLLLPQTCWEVPFPSRIQAKASKNQNKDNQISASPILMELMVPLRPVVIPLKAPAPAVRENTTFKRKQPKKDISCCLSWEWEGLGLPDTGRAKEASSPGETGPRFSQGS